MADRSEKLTVGDAAWDARTSTGGGVSEPGAAGTRTGEVPALRTRGIPTPATRPRHGLRSTYVGHGCMCAACKEANAAYRRQWARERNRPDGDPLRRMPASVARTELVRLRRTGLGLRTIAELTGLSRSTLMSLASASTTSVSRTTFEALAALDPAPRRIDAAPVNAALRALRASGFRLEEIAVLAGLDGRRVRIRHDKVERKMGAAIVDVFERCGGRLDRSGNVKVAPVGPKGLAVISSRSSFRTGRRQRPSL